MALRTHCQTSGWSLTAQDPFNNVVRTCIEAMAAALGHTQSLHTNALDEAIALPTDFSARIARNTQLILQEETADHRVVDPWGGSYFVERSHEIAQRAGSTSRDRGAGRHGQGHRDRPAQDAHRGGRGARQARIDSGETSIGVNKYQLEHEDPARGAGGGQLAPCARRRSRGWRPFAPGATAPRWRRA
jgi:methylmalonyl-CoA mutase